MNNDLLSSVMSGGNSVSKVPLKWRKENGEIRFSVQSDGTSCFSWKRRLEDRGSFCSQHAESMLKPRYFKVTTNVTTEIAVIGGDFFSDEDRTTEKILIEGRRRGYHNPIIEVACLGRELISGDDLKDMGFSSIVVMHDPVKNEDGDSFVFSFNNFGGSSNLSTNYDSPEHKWGKKCGFAFMVSSRPTELLSQKDFEIPINAGAAPLVPEGWKVVYHKMTKVLMFNPAKVSFYVHPEQKEGMITGHTIRFFLKEKLALNACFLDYLLDHQEVIPEEWKGKRIFFWGTIYQSGYNFYVRCLVWNYSEWVDCYDDLCLDFWDNDPAILAN